LKAIQLFVSSGIIHTWRFWGAQRDNRSRWLAMDDCRKRYCSLRNACRPGNPKGPTVVDQPIPQA